MKPNYEQSIINISATILDYYNEPSEYNTLPKLKAMLSKKYKHVVLMVLDGFGVNLMPYLSDHALLKTSMIDTVTSTFPSTTVAATTAILTAKSPYETGHLGWFQYLKPHDLYYTVFLKEDYYTHDKINNKTIEDYFKHETIFDHVGKHNIPTKMFFPKPVDADGYDSFSEGLMRLKHWIDEQNTSFSYFYSVEPDLTQHLNGPSDDVTKEKVNALNAMVTAFYDQLDEDTCVVVTADHGLIDVEGVELYDHPLITETFDKKPSLEPRATMFYIKESMKAQFEKQFNETFKDSFDLYPIETVIKERWFGYGKPHALVDMTLGNYMAIAKAQDYLILSHDKVHHGHHAGMSEAEMVVPLIFLTKRGT